MSTVSLVNLQYLAAAVFFILGVKGMGHPRTAVRGNFFAAVGMLVACVAVLLQTGTAGIGLIASGVAVGAIVGVVLALRTQMTAMPQLVAAFNGFGGAASALVAGAALLEVMYVGGSLALDMTVATALSAVIGAVTTTGSVIAFAKLQGIVGSSTGRFSGRGALTAIVAVGTLALAVVVAASPTPELFWGLIGASALLGILLTIPIGGADMPVVISLLNSYSGLAAAATGFVLGNNVLIIAGSLVGASGAILTQVMCKAMNRSLLAVLFGTGGSEGSTSAGEEIYAGKIKRTSPEEVAMLAEGVQRVVIVPGFGLAVAQAQHAVRDLANALTERGAQVQYAIHPVAGRMPGHMNVLLAEADVPYDDLIEMDEINPQFSQVDLTIIVGANDVVNPLAREDATSPIAGMPILEVDKSRTVVVIKRSLSPGFAGVANPLFAADNTLMLFGDGKKALLELVAAVKQS